MRMLKHSYWTTVQLEEAMGSALAWPLAPHMSAFGVQRT